MRLKPTNLAILAISLLALFGLTSCEWFEVEVLLYPDGYVIDVKTGSPLAGVEVTLTSTDGKFTKTSSETGTNGYYEFTGIPNGNYNVTASKSGYTFTKERTQISSLFTRLPQLGGFVTDNAAVLTFVTFWDEDYKDVDTYFNYPTAVGGGLYDPSGAFNMFTDASEYNKFYVPSSIGGAPDYAHPEFSSDNRTDVYYNNPIVKDGTETLVELDVDNRGDSDDQPGGPETISLYWAPFMQHNYGALSGGTEYVVTSADDPSKLPPGTYKWVASFDYKVNAFNATSSTGGDSDNSLLSTADGTGGANPVSYVFSGSTLLGKFTLPENIDIKHANMVRINYFMNSDSKEYFQILPNIEALAPRSADDQTVNQIVVAPGHQR
ncbi:carboxypeptidase-like regulatory domain-containing protein [Spirochaeta lutea]|uniref:Carboxypeptidase regulatory-like domain-containing protein n=1 Tax=Spirochaeta lutea TaxID=1480694 RepID=A0A098R155_9SPIO|nr:carboxypeptidase-like regulatory domain-containing protein [Spirochaeta lutea]KGE73835.1 hypothetical protein DC28_01055 [Spirochaeta lutea]